MICNVFVCNVWKHGGLFSGIENDIQCGETSVNDNYRLQLYSEEPLPGTDIDILLLGLNCSSISLQISVKFPIQKILYVK